MFMEAIEAHSATVHSRRMLKARFVTQKRVFLYFAILSGYVSVLDITRNCILTTALRRVHPLA